MDRKEFRQVCLRRAVDQEVQILPQDDGAWYTGISQSGKEYQLRPLSDGGYTCLRNDGSICPSLNFRGYCKHLAALDLYFIEHRIRRKTRESGTMTVVVKGKRLTWSD